eukprot:CAMPEP_0184353008 /NCGR_PEP_ID=MMETSP1089-20130417/73445_1 /TAXON_ID=38269 ORGANISM="Gloeochaete wittrockiana, Strain SAG46.84" /NCGR_SAMPLE_ID=MMETSP1089 /ASSEMBLY_ACC=CAM_ASM_000445 /LENGTH=208 /DNA_ID=CAMNT_0026688057 /DNA_START=28 /DNA_END=651 /DNA_ORIENTATION=-
MSNIEEDSGDDHPINQTYCFWFNKGTRAKIGDNYEKAIKKVGTFNTVEKFWSYYDHMIRPSDLPPNSDYHVFREGIRPLWEDEENKYGGKWIVRIPKGVADLYWESILMALVGGEFQVGDELCGIVLSIRFNQDIICVWNRDANSKAKFLIRETIQRVLELKEAEVNEYKNHSISIKDSSSFRNADQYRFDAAAAAAAAAAKEQQDLL